MTTRQNADYGYEIQRLYLEMMLSDAETFVRCQSIFDHELFDRKLQPSAKFINDYVVEHNVLPTYDIVNAATGSTFKFTDELKEEHYDWLLQDFETFIRHKGLEKAILASADLLEKGEYGPVEELVKKAVQVGLTGSGAGKSLFLANLGVNWALQGLNVVYLTLELSEELVSMRVDSMVTEIPSRDVFKQIDEVEMRVKIIGKKSGTYQVKYLPSGKTANDVRSYLKEYEIKLGRKVDILLLDYLDLLMPISKKISAENLFIKDKYVSEELRNLAVEKQCVLVTAAQLNRGAVEEVEFDHSHISGGLSKIQTADNVFGIFTSRAMRERGKYQIQLMKTRSSSGVGMKIDLDFNIDTLRITDPGEEGQTENSGGSFVPVSKGSSILNNLQRTSTTAPTDQWERAQPKDGIDPLSGIAVKKTSAQVESTKLRQLLNNLPSDI